MDFVIKWTDESRPAFDQDRRGWKNGKPRKYVNQEEKLVVDIYNKLVADSANYFCGASAIQKEWRKLYAGKAVPHLRFIGRVLKKHGLIQKVKKGSRRGATRYLLYPAYTILDKIAQNSLLEIDFMERYIRGRTEPVWILSYSLRGKRELKHYVVVESDTYAETKKGLDYFFDRFEKPYAVKMDNDSSFIGMSRGAIPISRLAMYLMSRNVIPIYSVPRKPFSQGSVEGANSMFMRKFYHRWEFKSVENLKEKLVDFNNSYAKYLGYEKPAEIKENDKFRYCMYHIRKIHEDEKTGKGYVQILSDKKGGIDSCYIGNYCLCEWDLETEVFTVYLQTETGDKKNPYALNEILQLPLKITPSAKTNVVDFYTSLNP